MTDAASTPKTDVDPEAMRRELPAELLPAAAADDGPWVRVTLRTVLGSAPREAGACMLVGDHSLRGSIGGGNLEWTAIATARELRRRWLAGAPAEPVRERHALGPALGQCCGGRVELDYMLSPQPTLPVAPPLFHLQLHGAGHVARAVVRALRPLPCRIDWIDERENEFPTGVVSPGGDPLPSAVRLLAVDAPQAEVGRAPAGTFYLVMTHRHDLDFAIGEAILRRGDFGWFGLIGSATKRARFTRRWQARSVAPDCLERLACPIGIAGIAGKTPEIIAVAVAAQLLQAAAA